MLKRQARHRAANTTLSSSSEERVSTGDVDEGAFKVKHYITCVFKLCQRGHQIVECWHCHRQGVQSKVPPLLEREENFETFANAAFFASLSEIAEKADKRLGQRKVW